MSDFSPAEVAAYYASRLPSLKQTRSRYWRGPCPVHNGDGDNFAVDSETGGARCHSQCGRGWDILGLEMELSRMDFISAKTEVFGLLGRPNPSWEDRDIVAAYDYTDEHGEVLYQVLRRYPKRFSQRRMGANGRWMYSLGDIERVPFQLPRFSEHAEIAVTEGEKDALTLTRLGIFATCNSEGAEKFRPELAQYFVEKSVLVFFDNDDAGRKHALKVAAGLFSVAKSVRIVEIPNLPAKGDVTDFVASGGTVDQLRQYIAEASLYEPGWEFYSEVPHEDDQWVYKPAQIVARYRNIDDFWDLSKQQGIPTPFQELTDSLGGGLRKGEVYTLAAERGFGKTSLALQFISHACQLGNGVLLFSLEMNDEECLRRMVSSEERVDQSQLRIIQKHQNDGTISISDERLLATLLKKLRNGTERAKGYKLLVHQKPRVTPKYLIKETNRLLKRQRIDLIVIDHMQLLGADGSESKEYEKISSVSRALKGSVARELQVPILLISQVTRANSKEQRAELESTDTRGSGAIDEDSAAVMLAYHDPQHVKELKATQRLAKGPIRSWLKLGKNRFGVSGSYIELMHWKAFTRFDALSDMQTGPDQPSLEVA